MTINYGKYRGLDIRDVPVEYLAWLLKSSMDTVSQIEAELRRRELAEEENSSMVELLIKTGYRELSKRFHPDAGGNHDQMIELNAAVELIRESL